MPRSPVVNKQYSLKNSKTFRDRSERQYITNHWIDFLTRVHKLAGAHALDCDKELLLVLVPEGMTERDLGEQGLSRGCG